MDWCEYSLTLKPEAEWRPPAFAGSMVRGAFGHSLKKLTCIMRHQDCDVCQLQHNCVYSVLFETRPMPKSDIMTKYDRVPHPYILFTEIENQKQIPNYAKINIGIRLFGETCQFSPFYLKAFEDAARKGLGKQRTKFSIENLSQKGSEKRHISANNNDYPAPIFLPPPSPVEGKLRIEIITPMRLKYNGKLLDGNNFELHAFLKALIRRYGLLNNFYGTKTDKAEILQLIENTKKIDLIRTNLAWKKTQRYSSRQRVIHSLGGLVGTIDIDVKPDNEMPKILAWLPIIHLGKNTSMGLGQINISDIN